MEFWLLISALCFLLSGGSILYSILPLPLPEDSSILKTTIDEVSAEPLDEDDDDRSREEAMGDAGRSSIEISVASPIGNG